MSKVLIFLSVFTLAASVWGQTKTYQSAIDQSFTIKKVAILPLLDNTKGIYSRPLTQRLNEILKGDRRFDVVSQDGGEEKSPEEIEDNSKLAEKRLRQLGTDAILISRLIKSTKGLSIRLSLVGGSEHLPIAVESLEDYQGFEISEVGRQLDLLTEKLLSRLPYQAVITSRQGQTVTLNAGTRHGLRPGDELYVILITGVERHPKFHFLTKVDREIMGKVKVVKSDESVSFAGIVSERSTNLIQPGFKISWSDFVTYPEPGLTRQGDFTQKLAERSDAPVVLGSEPREWTTGKGATFGKVALIAGISQASVATTLSAGDAPSATNPFSPMIRLDGEMWLDPHWQFNFALEQLAAKISNNLSGSSPSALNMQTQELGLLVGYNFLVDENDFWGPKFQAMAGLSRFSIFFDDSSPRAYSTKEYSGFAFGLGGAFPMRLDSGQRLLLGGRFLYYWQPTVSESPGSSGNATNQLSSFSVFMEYGLSERLALRADLGFKQASSSFSGGSGTSASANFTNLLGGCAFYF